LTQAVPPVQSSAHAPQQSVVSPQPWGATLQGPTREAGLLSTAPAGSGQLASGSAALMVPMADISAFIQELEGAAHIDSSTRNQILTTAFQTPPEFQPQLIRQYRALLALGHTAAAMPPSAAVVQAPSSIPAAVPLPAKRVEEVKKESVVAASHSELIEAKKGNSQTGEEGTSDVERRLEALLQAMKSTKVEAAEYAAVSEDADDAPARPREKAGVAGGDTSWEQLVDSAIKKLEERKDRQLESEIREEDEARLRMLYLIADRRDDAVRAIATLEPEMQEYWSKQFFALATLLNSDLIADRSNRLIESKRNLDEALRRLGESSPLFVRNLAFVTAVQSYGAYTPFDDYEFRPGEPVLLYAEVENYRCKETARGYHTALRSSYEIFDSARQKVADHEFSTNEEYCKNARRDFFTVCEFRIPERLNPGKYVLRLTVADLNGDKAGESSITFQIRGGK
jgi:hypothetical protein